MTAKRLIIAALLANSVHSTKLTQKTLLSLNEQPSALIASNFTVSPTVKVIVPQQNSTVQAQIQIAKPVERQPISE